MNLKKTILAFDVGEKRIGVAVYKGDVSIAIPIEAINVDGSEYEQIDKLISKYGADTLVFGYPRNQSGEITSQTIYVENFVKKIKNKKINILFQDESLTSVIAKEQLSSFKVTFTKADIDSKAAAIILQDYIDQQL